MKPAALLLGISVGANVLLAGALARQPMAAKAYFRALFEASPSAAREARPTASAGNEPTPAQAVPPSAPAMAELVDARALPDLVAQLRAAGCPPTLVQAVITGLIGTHFDARRAALRTGAEPAVFWKNTPYDPAPTAAARRQLMSEERKALRDILGPYAYASDDANTPERRARQFGNLPEATVERIRKLFADYEELTDQAFLENPSRVSPEGRAKSALLEKERRADLERLLSAEELFDYDVRNSLTARNLRGRLAEFDATEAEFRALYAAQKAFDELSPAPTRGPQTAETVQRQAQAEKQLDAELRRLLGEERYAEFQRANDHVYQQARAFVVRNGLPSATVESMAAIRKDFDARVQATDANRDLTNNQREAQRTVLATEAAQKFERLLGAANMQAYRQGEGAWLARLLERKATP